MATFPVRALSREVRYRLGNAQRWFIEIEGRVVGIFVTDITAEALHLSRVAIVPIYRGRGIGTRVLAHLERCARRIGIQRISLSVRKRNTRALKLYRRLGYTKCLEGAWYFKLSKKIHEN